MKALYRVVAIQKATLQSLISLKDKVFKILFGEISDMFKDACVSVKS